MKAGKSFLFSISLMLTTITHAQTGSDSENAVTNKHEVPVNIDNFIRAATDIEFEKYVSMADGVNRFYHFRQPTPIEKQSTIRMNRDTLYSTAIVDIGDGATLTLPDIGKRYMTAMIVNQDHYINAVFSGGGTYTLDINQFDTPYVAVFVRILVDSSDADDIAAVNTIQDKLSISARSERPFTPPNYDVDSYKSMVANLLPLAPYVPDSFRMFGPKEDVNPMRHYLGTAGGWGGLPENEAYYVGIEPGLPVGDYKIEVPSDVPVDAFWSISVYNAQGFFEPNDHDAYNVNSVSGIRNKDGSMTVHLGGCDKEKVNCLPIMEGWNYNIRMYRPRQEILDGSWTFPKTEAVK